MKRVISLILATLICLSCAVVLGSCGTSYDGEINVYNWGEYISDGSEDYVDVISQFEQEYNIKVNYTTYETNEELYNILSSSNSSYDVVIPSDYMIEKLIKEDLLQKLDYSNIPNYEDVMDRFKNPSYDPDNEYSVPYQWGVVGIVYNKEMVKEKPDSWEDLWNSDLSGSILQFNNSRDAYAIAMQLCGIDPTTFTKEDVDKATKKLKEQKPLLKKYVMDQVFAEMENDQSAIAPYYAGDIKTMMDNNENLDCALPKEGSNLYVDAMCIPKCAQNKEGAEKFINFMTSAEISKANSEYIGYATPVQGAYDLLDDDTKNNTFIYPEDSYLDKCYTFKNVDTEYYAYMQEQFVKLMS
jgi:spermidine/putrescine transport system substrate-binding protein